MLKYLCLGILFFTIQGIFAADVPVSLIQDDSSLRLSIKDDWLTAEPSIVIKNRLFTANIPGGGAIQVQAGRRGNELIIYLSRQRNGVFPGWAQGSWVYTRDFSTGAPVRVRVFLRSDPQTYIQFRPMGLDKTLLDAVVYEAYVIRGLAIGIPFERFLTMPLEEVLALAGNRFPRRYFEPDPELYRNICPYRENRDKNLISRIRAALPPLKYVDDGAIDENGKYVLIKDQQPQANPMGLNCSGFVKWVVDGMLRPVTGNRLTIAALKNPITPRTSSMAANFDNLDYLFGLDWTRNLALEAARVLRSPAFAIIENVEVRRETFASVIDRSKGGASAKSYPGFLLNAGFSIEGLRPLLYTLAIDEPGNIYLASVNRDTRTTPPMRQHYHVAVLIPYFNEYGVFQTAVFESAAETNLTGFIGRHPNAMVNLVRIPVEGIFEP